MGEQWVLYVMAGKWDPVTGSKSREEPVGPSQFGYYFASSGYGVI